MHKDQNSSIRKYVMYYVQQHGTAKCSSPRLRVHLPTQEM